uniref:Uncharacterized protein n=1 Tax=Arundo donax TaxID=35708 RepID=A0A0A9C9K5_ARUDO
MQHFIYISDILHLVLFRNKDPSLFIYFILPFCCT